MQRLTIETDSIANANFLASFLRTVKSVKKVIIEKQPSGKAEEPVEPYNWTNPSRPATDAEFEQLAVEMEQDKGEYSSEEVLNFVNKELKAWREMKK